MANKVTNHLSKQIGGRVTNVDLLNSIREKCSQSYQADIPELDVNKPISHNSVPYTAFQIHENEFFGVLINRIGQVVIKALDFESPLGVFKSENFEYGETIGEIYVHLAEKKQFNAKDDTSPFQYTDTDVEVYYHDLKDERRFDRTIERQWSIKAFTSEQSFDEFVDKMLLSLVTSDTLEEFETVKKLITNSLQEVKAEDNSGNVLTMSTPSMEFDTNEDDYILKFNKELIKRSNLFKVPSTTRFENGAQVPNATPIEEQYLLVSAEFSAELDSMLANAFNMDKASVLANKIVLDEFPTFNGEGKMNGAKPFAALVSKNTIILKDKLLQLEHIWNPKTLSFNYFLHHHQLISYSLLENAKIYYTK